MLVSHQPTLAKTASQECRACTSNPWPLSAAVSAINAKADDADTPSEVPPSTGTPSANSLPPSNCLPPSNSLSPCESPFGSFDVTTEDEENEDEGGRTGTLPS